MSSKLTEFQTMINSGASFCTIISVVDQIAMEYDRVEEVRKQEIVNCIKKIIDIEEKTLSDKMYIFRLSVLIAVTKKNEYLDEIIDLIYKETIPYNIKMFLYWQIVSLDFSREMRSSKRTLNEIYEYVFSIYANELGIIPLQYKNPLERNLKTIVLITGQFLIPPHSPTRVALGYINLMISQMGYNVILINEANQPVEFIAPFINAYMANHISAHNGWNEINYKDVSFWYYQSSGSLNNLDETRKMINFVQEINPFFVINLGGSSIVSDFCLKITDVVNFSLSAEESIATGGIFIGNYYDPNHSIRANGRRNIPGATVFEAMEQKVQLNRKEFDICDNDFLIAIVSNRLNEEITSDFLDFLDEFVYDKENIRIVFIGKYEKYEQVISRTPNLRKKAKCLGFQEDLVAIYDFCNLYLNPPRKGGGFSAIDAMVKGLPVVTFAGGDVGSVSQEAWAVNSYKDMERILWNFLSDKKEYENAKKRALEIGAYWKNGVEAVNMFYKIEQTIMEVKNASY